MKCSAVIYLLFSSLAMAAPTPQSRDQSLEEFGRQRVENSRCSPVQGRLVCDDGVGNTFFADDPLSS
ncbi:hypothetical protein CEP54_007616 [Fusarium duplospermum]|uniref:Uncharacterized protein n=1 Tax=Fusarium duplospermum TaxID=1325734 RepID=A0A428Q040_9HYPO|nr:hypothetical protein CEP54_007616 [Fusarium duplospermum]